MFLSSSRRTCARCVRSRGCAVGRGRQAAAAADAKPQTVKFFIQFLWFFFIFKKKRRKKAWEEVCCRHGRACSSGSLRMAVPGKQRCLLSQVGTEGVLLLPVPSCSSCSRAGGAVSACVVLGTSSDKLVSAGRWRVPPSPAWGGFWAVTGSLGTVLVLGLRCCCSTVKCKLNSDTYAPMLSILRNTNPR